LFVVGSIPTLAIFELFDTFYNWAQRQSVKKLPLSPTNVLKNVCTKDLFFVVLNRQHITGICRQELQMSSLEDKIGTENSVRFIDAFVEHISLGSIGFTT
jgi:hypothetical protein